MSTWGELRYQLVTRHPGSPPALVDAYLNEAYDWVLGRVAWEGQLAETLFTTFAPVTGIAATVVQGSQNIVLAPAVDVTWGLRQVYLNGIEYEAEIDTNNGTLAYLTQPYAAESGTAGAIFFQSVYTLPNDVAAIKTVRVRGMGDPLHPIAYLDIGAWRDQGLGVPSFWSPMSDTSEFLAPGALKQIGLWPAPNSAMPVEVIYSKAALGFDGTNETDSPLPWVTDGVLLAYAEHLLTASTNLNVSQMKAALAERLVMHLIRQDAERSPSRMLTFDPRFQKRYRW